MLRDLNGDNKLDIVNTNYGSNTISLLLGIGDGTFNKKPDCTVEVGSAPVDVALGDLNGDKILDIVNTNHRSNTISVLLGKGDGTFNKKLDCIVGVGVGPEGVVLGDLNGDKILDIITANRDENTVSVLLGLPARSGSNTPYYTQKQVPHQVGAGPLGIAAGDLNGDGQCDIVTANNGENTVSVLLGRGDGTFATQEQYPVGNGPWGVALADLNKDRMLDIITANSGGSTISVLLNTTPTPTTTHPTSFSATGTLTQLPTVSKSASLTNTVSSTLTFTSTRTVSMTTSSTNSELPTTSTTESGHTFTETDTPSDTSSDILTSSKSGKSKGDTQTATLTPSATVRRTDTYSDTSPRTLTSSVTFTPSPTLSTSSTMSASFTVSHTKHTLSGTSTKTPVQALFTISATSTPSLSGTGTPTLSKTESTATVTYTDTDSQTVSVTFSDTSDSHQAADKHTNSSTSTATPTQESVTPSVTMTYSETFSHTETESSSNVQSAKALPIVTPLVPIVVIPGTKTTGDYKSLARLKIAGGANGLFMNHDKTIAAITNDKKVVLVNTEDVNNPSIISTLDVANRNHAVFSHDGKILYVAAGTDGLKVIDVSNPSVPVVKTADVSGPILCAVLSRGSIAYLCSIGQKRESKVISLENSGQVIIANVGNALKPEVIGSASASSVVEDIGLSGSQKSAILMNGPSGISIVDVNADNTLKFVTNYSSMGKVEGAVFSKDEGYVYVGDSVAGLEVLKLDRSVPGSAKLTLMHVIETLGNATDVYLSNNGSLLFLASGRGGTKIFDIVTNPPYPLYKGSISSMDSTWNVNSDGDDSHVYIADGYGGFRVVQIGASNVKSSGDKPVGSFLKEQAVLISAVVGGILVTTVGAIGLYMKRGVVKNVLYKNSYSKGEEYIEYEYPKEYSHIPHDRSGLEISDRNVQVVRVLEEMEGGCIGKFLPRYFEDALKRKTIETKDGLPEWLVYDRYSNRILGKGVIGKNEIGKLYVVQIIARDDEILEEYGIRVTNGLEGMSLGSRGRMIEGPWSGSLSIVEDGEIRLDGSSIATSGYTTHTSVASRVQRVYIAKLEYENAILNDKDVGKLLKLALSRFGDEGMDRLIDMDGVGYKTFQALRMKHGDEKAVDVRLAGHVVCTDVHELHNPNTATTKTGLVLLGLIESKESIRYMWHEILKPVLPRCVVDNVELLPSPSALEWTGIHFTTSASLLCWNRMLTRDNVLPIAFYSGVFGLKEVLREQVWSHSTNGHELVTMGVSGVLMLMSNIGVQSAVTGGVDIKQGLITTSLQTGLLCLQCYGGRSTSEQESVVRDSVPYIVDLGVLSMLAYKVGGHICIQYGLMTLGVVALTDHATKVALSLVPDKVFETMDEYVQWATTSYNEMVEGIW